MESKTKNAFWSVLDRLIRSHFRTRADFARQAGLLPESLSALFVRHNLPRPKTLDQMLSVFSEYDQAFLIDSYMRSGLGQRWEKTYGGAFVASATKGDEPAAKELRMLATDRACGGLLSTMCERFVDTGVSTKAIIEVLGALMQQRPALPDFSDGTSEVSSPATKR